MTAGFFDHSFKDVIDRFGVGRTRKVWFSVLFLPAGMENALPFALSWIVALTKNLRTRAER